MPYQNSQEMGRPITIKDEGISIATNVGSMNMTGTGHTGSAVGADVTENFPGSSGSGAASTVSVTQGAHGFSVGNVLKVVGGIYALAQADSAANAEVTGIVSAVASSSVFTLLMGGYISGLSGLTADTTYFLSPTVAGALTATAPTTIGQISKPLLNTDTTASGIFTNMRGEILQNPAGFNGTIGVTFDGSGGVPTTTTKRQIVLPYNFTITGWTIISATGVSGSAVVDVRAGTFGGATSSIAGTDLPTLSSAASNIDTTLSGWGTLTGVAGTVIEFVLNSISTITVVEVQLQITKTS